MGNEPTVLRLADGEGCVRLLRTDEERGALLLERLGPPLFELGRPIEERHEILCMVAKRLWRPAPGSGLPTGADKARRLAAQIERDWATFAGPCSERAVEQALAAAERRLAAHDDERAVLGHGDVHQWNTLRAGQGFKLVDPDGQLAEREADLGVLMREDLDELMAGNPYERARWLALRTGTDAVAIWDWGLVERMSNGPSLLQNGKEKFGRMSLDAADRIAAAG